jgi:hypothetical protein
MRQTQITLPELALVGGTRAALGAGVGLLLADRLSTEQRRAVGWTLCIVGLLTTIPLAFEVLGARRAAAGEPHHGPTTEPQSEAGIRFGQRELART